MLFAPYYKALIFCILLKKKGFLFYFYIFAVRKTIVISSGLFLFQ